MYMSSLVVPELHYILTKAVWTMYIHCTFVVYSGLCIRWHTVNVLCAHQMKDDFQHLEDDMGTLGARMDEITSSSNSINVALEERKKEISKLCGVHHLLKKVSYH